MLEKDNKKPEYVNKNLEELPCADASFEATLVMLFTFYIIGLGAILVNNYLW